MKDEKEESKDRREREEERERVGLRGSLFVESWVALFLSPLHSVLSLSEAFEPTVGRCSLAGQK